MPGKTKKEKTYTGTTYQGNAEQTVNAQNFNILPAQLCMEKSALVGKDLGLRGQVTTAESPE